MDAKVAIVAGGAGDIGSATARLLLAQGWRVVVADLVDGDPPCATWTQVPKFVHVDCTVSSEVETAVADIVREHGRLDGAVFSVGYWQPSAVEDVSDTVWEKTIAVNLTGAFRFARAVGRHMKTQRKGSVVILSSALAVSPSPQAVHYAAAKAGVGAMVQGLSLDFGPAGLRINAVAPGIVRSRMASRSGNDADLHQVIERIPLRRAAEPSDIASTISFLLSDAARHLTGQTLFVRGGP